MNNRYYYTMFKNEPDVLTVPDVVRLLQLGKNTVYALIKDGRIASIKQGKKIIVPKVCLVEFLPTPEIIRLRPKQSRIISGLVKSVVIVLVLPENAKENSKRKEREKMKRITGQPD